MLWWKSLHSRQKSAFFLWQGFVQGMSNEQIASSQVILGFRDCFHSNSFCTWLWVWGFIWLFAELLISVDNTMTEKKTWEATSAFEYGCRPASKSISTLAGCWFLIINVSIEGLHLLSLGLKWSLSLQRTQGWSLWHSALLTFIWRSKMLSIRCQCLNNMMQPGGFQLSHWWNVFTISCYTVRDSNSKRQCRCNLYYHVFQELISALKISHSDHRKLKPCHLYGCLVRVCEA